MMLSFLRKPVTETKSLACPDDALLSIFTGFADASGTAVTPSTAMRCAPVRCAVEAISGAVGQLPVALYKRNPDGTKTLATDHPALKLMNCESSDGIAASDFRDQLQQDVLLHGNAYAYINRVNKKVVEITRIRPDFMQVAYDPFDPTQAVYNVTEGAGTSRTIPSDDLIHLKAPSFNGLWGDFPIIQARDSIAVAIVMERHALNLFTNGARPSGTLNFPKKLGADVAARLKAAWSAAFGGSKSGVAILEEGAEWKSLTLNSVDAQFLELRKFAINEIARVFHVPPHMLYEMGDAKWANVSQAADDFVRFSLLTWLRRWEKQYLKLFTADERDQYVVEFQVDDFLRADPATQATAYATLRSAGLITANEARQNLKLPPHADGDKLDNPNTSSPHAAPAVKVAA